MFLRRSTLVSPSGPSVGIGLLQGLLVVSASACFSFRNAEQRSAAPGVAHRVEARVEERLRGSGREVRISFDVINTGPDSLLLKGVSSPPFPYYVITWEGAGESLAYAPPVRSVVAGPFVISPTDTLSRSTGWLNVKGRAEMPVVSFNTLYTLSPNDEYVVELYADCFDTEKSRASGCRPIRSRPFSLER